jgi:hypothetical protein
MRLALAIVVPIGLYIFTAVEPLPAQMQNNTEKRLSCDENRGRRLDRSVHCEMREQSFASIGRLSVEGHNGGITV